MIAFAEHEFRLGRKRGDGATEREHLESAQRQIKNLPGWKGKKTAEVLPEGPPFPDELGYLWRLFSEVSMGLSSNGMGPALVTWEALQAWCGEMRHILDPWEKLALVRLGYARAVIEGEKMAKEAKKPPGQS